MDSDLPISTPPKKTANIPSDDDGSLEGTSFEKYQIEDFSNALKSFVPRDNIGDVLSRDNNFLLNQKIPGFYCMEHYTIKMDIIKNHNMAYK